MESVSGKADVSATLKTLCVCHGDKNVQGQANAESTSKQRYTERYRYTTRCKLAVIEGIVGL